MLLSRNHLEIYSIGGFCRKYTHLIYVHCITDMARTYYVHSLCSSVQQKKWNSAKAIPIKNSVQVRACYQTARLPGKNCNNNSHSMRDLPYASM